ncbi:MAG: hypothetical protein P9X24_15215 [Candidatus Hatepunaea meridiana]|nr:hypothetical protein [Candidatus Hatepunaea meridiana]
MTERVTNILELVKNMGDNERLELISQLFQNDIFSDIIEDVEDLLLYYSRRNEPTEDFMEFVEELRREGHPV